MGKEFDMFDDLFKDEDFSLEDEDEKDKEEEGEEIGMETSDEEDSPPESDPDDDPDDDPESDKDDDDPVPCDCDHDDACAFCSSPDDEESWDTGGGQRPVPDNVWKPKSWKTI